MIRRVLILFALAATATCSCGCAVMDTGPRVVESAIASATGVAMEAFKDLRASQGQAGMDADVNDPEYFMEVMTGPVYVVRFRIGLTGADMGAHIQTSLVTDEDITPEDTALAREILRQPDLTRERQEALLFELTNRGLAFWERILGISGGDDRTTTTGTSGSGGP